MTTINISIAGVRHAAQQCGYDLEEYVRSIQEGDTVRLVAEPDNPFDSDAVRAFVRNRRAGYVGRQHSALVSQLLRQGSHLDCRITSKDEEKFHTLYCAIKVSEDQIPERLPPAAVPPSLIDSQRYAPTEPDDHCLYRFLQNDLLMALLGQTDHLLPPLLDQVIPLAGSQFSAEARHRDSLIHEQIRHRFGNRIQPASPLLAQLQELQHRYHHLSEPQHLQPACQRIEEHYQRHFDQRAFPQFAQAAGLDPEHPDLDLLRQLASQIQKWFRGIGLDPDSPQWASHLFYADYSWRDLATVVLNRLLLRRLQLLDSQSPTFQQMLQQSVHAFFEPLEPYLAPHRLKPEQLHTLLRQLMAHPDFEPYTQAFQGTALLPGGLPANALLFVVRQLFHHKSLTISAAKIADLLQDPLGGVDEAYNAKRYIQRPDIPKRLPTSIVRLIDRHLK